MQSFLRFRLWLNTFGIPGVVFWGEWWCPFLPKRQSQVTTYVGAAIQLPLLKEPTNAEIDHWHAEYVLALRKLFDKYKGEAIGGEEGKRAELIVS
jgi:hypothetical protein